jgi:hypothetical protein
MVWLPQQLENEHVGNDALVKTHLLQGGLFVWWCSAVFVVYLFVCLFVWFVCLHKSKKLVQ